MTAADQLRMEDRMEGHQATARQLVKGAMKLGMDAKTITDTFEMPLDEVQAIMDAIRQEQVQPIAKTQVSFSSPVPYLGVAYLIRHTLLPGTER